MSAVRVLRDARSASQALHPPRPKMLALLAEPGSASSLAAELGIPRQQANYHVRELEKLGLVEFFEERRKGNCVERLVRAPARTYLIDPQILQSLGGSADERRDRFSAAWLISAASRIVRDLAVLSIRAAKAGKRLSTLTMETEIRFRSAGERTAFANELAESVARLTARYHDESVPGGRLYRVVVGTYPAITKQEPVTNETAELE